MARKIYFRGLTAEDNEAFAAGLASSGWVEVPGRSVTDLCHKSEGITQVSEEDKAALNPSYNSRYNMLRSSLMKAGTSDHIIPMLGIHAIRIAKGEDTYLQLNKFDSDEFTELYAKAIKRDVGRDDAYCVLIYKSRDGEENLLAVYYDNIFLVPVAGITRQLALEISVPWLKATSVGIRWEDPMPYLTPDQQVRLYSMVKAMYPVKNFPGIAEFLKKHEETAGAGDDAQLRSYVKLNESEDVIKYVTEDKLKKMTVPGYTEQGDLPRIFNDKLAVIQGGTAPYMGAAIEYKGETLSVVPPLAREILDSGFAVTSIDYIPKVGEDRSLESIEVRVRLDIKGETVVRRASYAEKDMLDITGIDNIIQMNHMDGVSDADWKGRFLIRTKLGATSFENVSALDGIRRVRADAYLPNGSDKVRSYEIASENAAWHLYKTGVATRYLTLISDRGVEIANLITSRPEVTSAPARIEDQGIVSFDGGATSIVCHTRLDSGYEYAPLKVKASEIAQPVTPMDKHTFALITSTITLPDVEGDIHPTAVEKFFIASSDKASDLRFPGAFMRLLSFNDEQLARMMELRQGGGGHRRSGSVIMNMKDAAEYSGGVSDRRDAYVTAVATFMELAVLKMISQGQKDIKILFAYPKGVRNGLAVVEAKNMLDEFIGPDVRIEIEAYAESTASATYVRKHGKGEAVITRKSPLLTIDIGGFTSDVSLYFKGRELFSGSYSYASIISQLSAGLVLFRGEGRKKDLRSIFGSDAVDGKLSAGLCSNMCEAVRSGGRQMNEAVYKTENRKLLEQLYRKDEWSLLRAGSFVKNFHKLWMLPIIDMICEALKGRELHDVAIAFTGVGSLFVEKLFSVDAGSFKERVVKQIRNKTGIDVEIMFVASGKKEEVAVGMINAFDDGIRGVSADEIKVDKTYVENLIREALARAEAAGEEELEADLRAVMTRNGRTDKIKLAEVRDLADEAVAACITRDSYRSFVEELTADEMIDSEFDEYLGFDSVYDTLIYEAEGFDNFNAIVESAAERFGGISGNGSLSERLLHYLVAFEIANRNLLKGQQMR